jgi:hypothetical protein
VFRSFFGARACKPFLDHSTLVFVCCWWQCPRHFTCKFIPNVLDRSITCNSHIASFDTGSDAAASMSPRKHLEMRFQGYRDMYTDDAQGHVAMHTVTSLRSSPTQFQHIQNLGAQYVEAVDAIRLMRASVAVWVYACSADTRARGPSGTVCSRIPVSASMTYNRAGGARPRWQHRFIHEIACSHPPAASCLQPLGECCQSAA